MNNDANKRMQELLRQMSYEEKIIVLAVLEQRLSERETALFPAR